MTAVLLVVGLLIVAAIFFAVGAPRARSRRTVVVERARPVRHVRTVVETPPVVVERAPVVEEIIEDRY